MVRAQWFAAVLELAGMAAIVAGVAMLSIPVAAIVGGVGLVVVGLSLGVQAGER
jgi:hypothetical protein